jgi:tight adherence protein C
MLILTLSCAAMAFLISLCLFSDTIKMETVKKQQLKWISGTDRFVYDEELAKSFLKRFFVPAWEKLLTSLSKLTKEKPGSAKQKENNQRLENELRLAGMKLSAREFSLLRIMCTVAVLSIFTFAAIRIKTDEIIKVLILLSAAMMAVLIPRYILKARIKSRQQKIQNQLPNVLDVLSVSIEAGLGFDAALLRIMEKFDGPLIDEFAQMHREVQMGRTRRDALTSLAQQTNVAELQTFASALIQAEQFGTPIKNVLRTQAQQLRVNRRQQAQEKGAKAPIKMMMPTVFFIFPVIFIILLGPLVINLFAKK